MTLNRHESLLLPGPHFLPSVVPTIWKVPGMTYLPKVSPPQPAPSASIFGPLSHGSTSSSADYLQEGDRMTPIAGQTQPSPQHSEPLLSAQCPADASPHI